MATAAALATRLGKDRLGPDERADAAQLRAALGILARGLVAGRAAPDRAADPGPGPRHHGRAPVPVRRHVHREHPHRPQPALATRPTPTRVCGRSGWCSGRRRSGSCWRSCSRPVLVAAHRPARVDRPVPVARRRRASCCSSRPTSRAAVLVAAGFLGLAAQGAKIAVDTIVQRDTDDAFRGRAFALYDVLYNAAFVGAAALGAVTLPDTGYSQRAVPRPRRRVRRVRRPATARPPEGYPPRTSPRHDWPREQRRQGGRRQDDLPLNAVLDSDLALSISDALAARRPARLGQRARSPGSPATRPTRSSAATAGSCRARTPTRVAVARIRTALDERPHGRHGHPQLPPRRHAVLEPGGDQPGRRRGRRGHPPHRHPGRRHRPRGRRARPRPRDRRRRTQATARLDLLARISDELAQHLEYDAAVDALGDIADPGAGHLGLRRGDRRPRPVRPRPPRRRRPGRPRDRARAGATRTSAGCRGRPRSPRRSTSRPGFVATPYPIDVAGLPGRTTPAQLDLLRRLGLGQRDGRPAARP